jgi:hypothetical protein
VCAVVEIIFARIGVLKALNRNVVYPARSVLAILKY